MNIVEQDIAEIIAAPLPWQRLRGKTIVVTGAAGFIPAYMVEVLLHANRVGGFGCQIYALVRNLEKAHRRFLRYGPCELRFIHADVTGSPPLPQSSDFIVHAASPASPKLFGVDPVGTMHANYLGARLVLEHARVARSGRVLFISSGEVYGSVAPDKIPTREGDYGYIDITDVRSCYAESKRAAETLGVSYWKQYGVNFIAARPFHTYGPGMALDDGRIFADFARALIERTNLVLHSDGKAVRSFCYLSDAILGLFTVMLKGEIGSAYNVGNPHCAISIADLAQLLVDGFPEFRLKVIRKSREGPYLSSRISVNIPNVDCLTALGWAPKHGILDGFRRTITSFAQQPLMKIDPIGPDFSQGLAEAME